ncbi:Cullin-domain-containing protein [Westerdykella ornata]|uniref:Cullin-1 n=1 Tax=Westerdykella ornata TaxID=318751 RepID=A0A6A6JW69_WESOR|nr:Cullin-domain-containing protein [Westerdykella ornata]KAF2279299.1 Cullin-domain-containing protein [Westerdykella ornata]
MKSAQTLASMPPPPKDDVERTWAYLQTGLEKIMTDLRGGMDLKVYMALYTAIHNFCTAQKAVFSNMVSGQSGSRGGAHLLGEELYKHLIAYLTKHLKEVQRRSREHTDEALLTFYIKEWNRYTTAAQYNNHLFRYLNRHWVKREIDEGKKHIYDIYTLHLVRWKEDMFLGTQEAVMRAVLKLVEKQRNGETIEQSHIKSVVDSFVSLGLDESDSTKPTLDVYKEYFERPFLEATEKYYENESKQFIAENSVVEYMRKAETRLEEEKDRVSLYLLSEIMSPLMRACEKALITNHVEMLRDEFQTLLDEDKQQDLARMYKLLARIPEGLDPLRQRFEAHVRKAGLNAVDKVAQNGENIDPKVYVEALLEVHTQYQKLVNFAFNGESEFVRSLDNACREFVNRNSVCKSGSSKSPELLAKYADTLLKKSPAKMVEEDDMEKLLTELMTVFKYIEDKDVFQKFYSRMLAKRLVGTTSASDDAETSMIAKLKETCGFEYTNKLQRMFQDMQISKDLNANYKEWRDTVLGEDSKSGIDATFHILGTGFWPLTPPQTAFTPPQVISDTYERFTRFYNNKHQGRKLTWLWHLCKGEVKMTCCRVVNAKISPILQVSTYQMAILLLFNESDTLSYDDLVQGTGLIADILNPSISVLLKSKVLLAEPEGAKAEPGATFKVNTGFKTKKMKTNLNIGIKSEQKQEVEDTHKTIEEDRKLLVQSAIVRIMKSRKKMKHQQLVSETIQQIKNRFQPRVPDIKKCIDILLEKEYLERLEGDELGYLA